MVRGCQCGRDRFARGARLQVNLDDAWLAPTRDRFGRMVGDPGRFPRGIKWLADKLHSMGLKLGLCVLAC